MATGKDEQASVDGSARADRAAMVIASIIIAGLLVMFGYGILGWIIFG
jgi:F0F1-type ATP synthase assembly protein I